MIADFPDIPAADYERDREARLQALCSSVTTVAVERNTRRAEMKQRREQARAANAAKRQAIARIRKELLPVPKEPAPQQFVQQSYRTTGEIMTEVERYYQLNPGSISGPRRFRALTDARQIAMYLCRTVGRRAFADIGKAIRRDHSTVMHGVESVGERIGKDPQLAAQVAEIMLHLGVTHGCATHQS